MAQPRKELNALNGSSDYCPVEPTRGSSRHMAVTQGVSHEESVSYESERCRVSARHESLATGHCTGLDTILLRKITRPDHVASSDRPAGGCIEKSDGGTEYLRFRLFPPVALIKGQADVSDKRLARFLNGNAFIGNIQQIIGHRFFQAFFQFF